MKRPRVIENVLVRGALRAPVGTVKIETPLLADPVFRSAPICWYIATMIRSQLKVSKRAIHFVCRSENQRRRILQSTDRFQHLQSSARVHVKIVARVDQAVRHRRLRGKMKNG